MLKVADVVERLNVSLNTIYRLSERGDIPVVRNAGSLRFDPVDLEAWLLSQRQRRTTHND